MSKPTAPDRTGLGREAERWIDLSTAAGEDWNVARARPVIAAPPLERSAADGE